jgi:hypothetical protein
MAYSDFSLSKVKKEFGLTEEKIKLFPDAPAIEPSEWLKTTLNISLRLSRSQVLLGNAYPQALLNEFLFLVLNNAFIS